MKKIIIVSGKATHGKDETAGRIKKILTDKGNNCLTMQVGDSLKYVCTKYFGWDGQKDEKGRTILQHVGTDVCRKNNPHIWAKIFLEILTGIETEFDYVFVSDIRMPDEIDTVKQHFGDKALAIRVNRINYVSPLTLEQQRHITEVALDNYKFDRVIINDTLEGLQRECEIIAKEIDG